MVFSFSRSFISAFTKKIQRIDRVETKQTSERNTITKTTTTTTKRRSIRNDRPLPLPFHYLLIFDKNRSTSLLTYLQTYLFTQQKCTRYNENKSQFSVVSLVSFDPHENIIITTTTTTTTTTKNNKQKQKTNEN